MEAGPVENVSGTVRAGAGQRLYLWDIPDGMRQWLRSERGCLFAEDVDRCLGSFDELCPPGNFNAGIRGLAPGIDLEEALDFVLREVSEGHGGRFCLTSEIEEQGLQAAAICQIRPLFLVRTYQVSLCSPFWPRVPEFGTCGAHFVGMNAHIFPGTITIGRQTRGCRNTGETNADRCTRKQGCLSLL